MCRKIPNPERGLVVEVPFQSEFKHGRIDGIVQSAEIFPVCEVVVEVFVFQEKVCPFDAYIQKYIEFGVSSRFFFSLVVKLHGGRSIIVGIEFRVVEQIDADNKFQHPVEENVFVIIVRV